MKQGDLLKFIGICLLTASMTACGGSNTKGSPDYPIQPVPFTSVEVSDNFWSPRLETNRTVTIPYALEQCEVTERVKNFEQAASVLSGEIEQGLFCTQYTFDDSDLFKIIEGAAYALNVKYDAELDKRVDDLIAKIAAAQEGDGYLYTARTSNPEKPHRWVKEERWDNLYMGHELYNMGHLYEAAYAHHLATGKRNLLDIALKNADLIASEFGPENRRGVPGHQVIEIGLAKLYRITGDKKYLDLAKFFLDERGNPEGHELFGEYSQDHKPVVDQNEAVGHAVRAAYMYAGMADIAALAGDQGYIDAIDKIWENVVTKKIYLTGGIGATGSWEGFGPEYELPNAIAYAETCASIANVFWNHRMFLLHGDAKYIDVLERVIYNGALSGTGFSGKLFFYPNPLASFGQHQRSPWFACACCPSNVSRFMPSIPGYAYAVKDDQVYVNLFIQGTTQIEFKKGTVQLENSTNYPWKGDIRITVNPETHTNFTLKIRIPGWARSQPIPGDLYTYMNPSEKEPQLQVNGEPVDLQLDKGYATLDRKWKAGDTVALRLPMGIRRVQAHPEVSADKGRVAVERGPLVYCAEWPDNGGRVHNLILEDSSALSIEERPDLLNGVTVIHGSGMALKEKDGEIKTEEKDLLLIPYYAWAHRGRGEMAVWLAQDPDKARPLPEASVASTSKATGSGGRGIEAINDRYEPENSNDHSVRYFHWWPKRGTLEWVQYDFEKPITVSEVSVYWFDDTGQGGCRVPQSWKVLYERGNQWIPVKNIGSYGVEKDSFNTVLFDPVRTSALRLEIQQPEKFSSGIHEWKVK
ncbi:beta-L-arabinofuranosidase domain-containing protein [Acidobacteriota bacterium]